MPGLSIEDLFKGEIDAICSLAKGAFPADGWAGRLVPSNSKSYYLSGTRNR